jgi:hypothetical protein
MKRLTGLALIILVLAASGVFAQPTGSITAFAGSKNKVPRGWVICDGSLYDRTTKNYTRLFNAIGTTWGGDGTNKFAVPDLRGLFLRGVSDESQADPDRDERVASRQDLKSSGNRGNQVGSKQADQFASHRHNYSDRQEGVGNQADGGDDIGLDKITHPDTEAAGGNETRPKNAYVYYIIKL